MLSQHDDVAIYPQLSSHYTSEKKSSRLEKSVRHFSRGGVGVENELRDGGGFKMRVVIRSHVSMIRRNILYP